MRIEKLEPKDIQKMSDTELHEQREQFVQIYDRLWKGDCWPGIPKRTFAVKYAALAKEMDERELGIKPRGIDVSLLRKSLADIGSGIMESEGDRVDISKPFPGEHACRLKEPSEFKKDSFRRTTREHDGKEYSIIQGKLKGESSMTEQAYRYDKDDWSESEARNHCDDHDGIDFEPAVEIEKTLKIIKQDAPERIVLGIVAEPDEVDTHGDQQTAEEIEKASNWFMEEAQNITIITDENHDNDDFRVTLLQNFIAPVDMIINDEVVKKGSWLQGVRLGEDTWEKVESGELTGFSMKGTAIRKPD